MNQPKLFESIPHAPEKPLDHPNKMVRKNGLGPKEKKCKSCNFLLKRNYHGKNYYKCVFLAETRGAGSDIKLKWDACSLYKNK